MSLTVLFHKQSGTPQPVVSFERMLNELVEPQTFFEKSDNTIGYENSFEIMLNGFGTDSFGRSLNDLTDIVNTFERMLNGFGTDSFGRAMNALGSGLFEKSDNTIGYENSFERMFNGFGTEAPERCLNSLGRHVFERSSNMLTFAVLEFERMLNDLSLGGDPAVMFERMVNSMASRDTFERSLNEVSEASVAIERMLNDLALGGNPMVAFERMANSMDARVMFERLLNEVSGASVFPERMLNDLGGSAQTQFERSVNEVVEKDVFVMFERSVNEVSESDGVPGIWRSTDRRVLFDGIDITDMLSEWSFTHDRGSPHNQFSASSMNRELFRMMDPETKKDEARIEIRVGTRSLLFCFETKAGDQLNFQIWGRSRSALDDDLPNDTKRLFHTPVPVSAREMAASALTANNLVWNIPDWNLPAYYEYEGTPLGLVLDIVSGAKAVARCADNGDIVVDKKLPERPVRLNSAQCHVSFDTANILSDGYTIEDGTGFDAILVEGWSPEIALPELEVEESSPVRGTTVHIREYQGYVERSGKPEVIEQFVTAGVLTFEGGLSEEKEEIVTFNTGSGSVGKPISRVTGVEWIGHNCGDVSYTSGQKELRISGGRGEHGIARVNYVTDYDRYRLDRHNIDMILAVWSMWGPNVSVMVRMNGGTNEAPAVSDSRLTGVQIAVERGTAELDDIRYDKIAVDADVPYDDNTVDGNIAWFDHEDILAVGNFYIKSVTTTCNGPQIKQKVRLEKPRLI